jgi:TolA-binding protein
VAPSASPGEAEFRAGWAALRAGDASAAAKAFSTACTEAAHGALGEDACFWAGAAAKRAGDAAMARTALEQFGKMFPTSARAAEAAALLGWLLYDAGELDRAERLFHQAESDRVPKVRESAQHGLAAIQRKRGTP